MKQDITLFDEFASSPLKWQKQLISPNTLRAATKFVLDEQASAFVGDLISNIGPELLSQHEFARSPYPITWIEVKHRHYWAALTGKTPDEHTDNKWGVLIDHGTAYIISSSGPHRGGAMVLPIRFLLGTPIPLEDEHRLANLTGMSRLILRRTIVGSIGDDPSNHDDLIRDVVYNNRMEIMERWLSYQRRQDLTPELWHKLMQVSSGDLKLVIVLLLLLTRPGRQVILKQDQPRRTGIHRGKRAVFLEHTTVHMRLTVRDPITKVLTGLGSGVSKRRHPVRGHWCQSRKIGRGCEHKWVALDEDNYECALGCGAKRWWRDNCWRGKFDEGFVSREGYEVHR